MFKTIGLIIVFFCSLGIGAYSASTKKKALKQMEELLHFIRFIRLRIDYFNSTLDNIYTSYTPESQSMITFIDSLQKNGWSDTLKDDQNIKLSKYHTKLFSEFGEILGKTPKDEQLTQIDYYLDTLDKELEKLKKDTPDKAKLAFSLWVYGGLLLIILFL